MQGKRIVVVGGGMTAAQLALGAVERGAQHVTLVSRHALCAQPLPCQARAHVCSYGDTCFARQEDGPCKKPASSPDNK